MEMSSIQVYDLVRLSEFERLFVAFLGWDYDPSDRVTFYEGGQQLLLRSVATRSGFKSDQCTPQKLGRSPRYAERRKIGAHAAKFSDEHLVIFVNEDGSLQIWHWTKRRGEQPPECVERKFVCMTGD